MTNTCYCLPVSELPFILIGFGTILEDPTSVMGTLFKKKNIYACTKMITIPRKYYDHDLLDHTHLFEKL